MAVGVGSVFCSVSIPRTDQSLHKSELEETFATNLCSKEQWLHLDTHKGKCDMPCFCCGGGRIHCSRNGVLFILESI